MAAILLLAQSRLRAVAVAAGEQLIERGAVAAAVVVGRQGRLVEAEVPAKAIVGGLAFLVMLTLAAAVEASHRLALLV